MRVAEPRDSELEHGHWGVFTLEFSSTKLLAAKPISRADFELALSRDAATRLNTTPDPDEREQKYHLPTSARA